MRTTKLVTLNQEIQLIDKLGDELLSGGFNASNSCIITVSTDYSSMVGQILRHKLSFNGEIVEGFGVDVPYPDEEWDKTYISELTDTFRIHQHHLKTKTPILVEAGVIRGGNYMWLKEWMRKYLGYDRPIVTLALYENLGSKFKSDFVGDYYDDTLFDLTFWWERDDKHWQ